MTTAARLLAWATSKIGTVIPTPGVAFAVLDSCSLFTSAGYEDNGIPVSSEISPAWQAGWFEKAGRYDTTPEVGAQIFIDLTGQGRQVFHTGFVTKVYPDGSTDTIENNAGAHDGHPNGVFPNHRGPVGDGFTLGFGHPPYTVDQPTPTPTLRTMYDSVTATDIPVDAQMVAGYLNGRYAWSAADWARFPNAQHIGIVIYIPGRTPPNDGDVLDIEAGDAPGARAIAAQWVADRLAAGAHPTIYTSRSTAHFFDGLFCTFWIADYTGVEHMVSMPGFAVVATQYASPGNGSGGHYDLSLVANDWHPATVPPPPAPVVTHFPEDHMKHIAIRVEGTTNHGPVGLDDQGNGSTLLDVPMPVVNAYPNTAGYTVVPEFVGAEDEGGKAKIIWKGPPNFPPFDAHILVPE